MYFLLTDSPDPVCFQLASSNLLLRRALLLFSFASEMSSTIEQQRSRTGEPSFLTDSFMAEVIGSAIKPGPILASF